MNLPKIETAMRRVLRTIPHPDPAQQALGAVGLRLARTLDEDAAGSMTASVARELRACLAALVPDRDGDGDELEELLGELRR
jgi:hypothetical protein